VVYFRKLDLKSWYHEIRLRKNDIPQKNLKLMIGTMSSWSCLLGLLFLLQLFKYLWTKFSDTNLESLCWFSLMISLSMENHENTTLNTSIKSWKLLTTINCM
jgi:hypothetical protein